MLSAHAGAAWWVMRTPPEPLLQEAASASIEVDLAALGFTSADQVSAGEIAETVEPVTSETARPVTEATHARPVEPPSAEPVAETPRPVEAQPVEPTRTAEPVEPRPVRHQPTQESPPSEVSTAALTPVERPETVETAEAKPTTVEKVEPVEESQQVAALVNVPLPTPRPDYTPTAMPRAEKPVEQKQAQKSPPKKSGSAGQNQADARKGVADGSRKGRAEKQANQGQRNSAAGNAAVSNYPGKVASKLRRSLRYPAAARRQKLRGEVHVSFTVASSGSVASARIARSSGSPVLDQAALETVRRAAPFPPIPEGAGRSSWPFTVPLAFTR